MTRVDEIEGALRERQAGTAHYCAGGTTLIDLMRQDVERPERVDCDQPSSTSIDRSGRRWRARDWCARDPTATLRTTNACAPSTVCSPKRYSPARRRRFATWRPPAAICSSAPVVSTTAIRILRATSASPAPASRDLRVQSQFRCARYERALHRGAIHPTRTSRSWRSAQRYVRNIAVTRTIPIAQFYVLPGATPERETTLEPGELIVGVTLPPMARLALALPQAARPAVV